VDREGVVSTWDGEDTGESANASPQEGGEGMKKWWLVGAVAGLMLLGACQSETDSARTEPTPTVEEATVVVKEASERASESVDGAMEGVQPEEGHEPNTVTAKRFVNSAYEASDIAEFCAAIDVLGEAISYDLFLEGAGELGDPGRSAFDFPSTREVFDELMGRC
jgi:hypothetical protein